MEAKQDADMFVNLTSKFRSKYEGKSEPDTHPNISKTTYSGAEVICVGENAWRGIGQS